MILLIGETKGWLGQSIYLREICGREEGAPPPVDLAAERRNGDFVRGLIRAGRVDTVHDCSDGGLAVALAEMAMAGGIGASICRECPGGLPRHAVSVRRRPGPLRASPSTTRRRDRDPLQRLLEGRSGRHRRHDRRRFVDLAGGEAISVAACKAGARGLAARVHGQELSPAS